MGNCKFNESWLERNDITGRLIKTWFTCIPNDNENGFCIVCKKKFSLKKGFMCINQHCSGKLHKNQIKVKLDPQQLILTTNDENGTTSNREALNVKTSECLQLYSNRDAATKFELQWCLKIVCSNWPINSCNGLAEFMKCIFPKESIPNDFTLSCSKIRYLVGYALGPYFRNELLTDIANSYYAIQYDETTNVESEKELHINIRYFSNKLGRVINCHLETKFLGHATSQILTENILKVINDSGLSLAKCLMLASDGPNVNKSVWRQINEKVKETRGKPLLDLGTCNLHIIHNSFLKGLESFGLECSDFIISLYYFFHGWPTRKHDYEKLQESLGIPKHAFIKHIATRWLTLDVAVERALEQWPVVLKYFLEFLPKYGSKAILQSKHYTNVKNFIKNPTSKALLYFISTAAKIFLQFTSFFQKDEPLVHLMGEKIKKIVIDILLNCINEDTTINFSKLNPKDIFQDKNYLPINQINPGQKCMDLMNTNDSLKENDKVQFLCGVKKFYTAAATHIINKIPLLDTKLKYLTFLDITKILSKEQEKADYIKYLVKIVNLLPGDFDIDQIIREFKNLKIDEFLLKLDTKGKRIDEVWSIIASISSSDNIIKYEHLTKVVKQCLVLVHGSAAVERAFSQSGRILTYDKAKMNVKTLNSLLYIQDGVKLFYYNKPEFVVISKELLKLARIAYSAYNTYLEREKAKKEEMEKKRLEKIEENKLFEKQIKDAEEEKKTMKSLEQQLLLANSDKKQKHEMSTFLIDDATQQLKTALKKKDFAQIAVVQILLEIAKKVKDEEAKKEQTVQKLQKQILKRKNNTLDTFIVTKKVNINIYR